MSDTLFSVRGTAAVVTGAASGIGRAITLGLARAGARVTAGDLDSSGLNSLAAEAADADLEVAVTHCDVGDAQSVSALVDHHMQNWGRLDSAFANAGIAGSLVPATAVTLDDLHAVLRVNLDGVLLLSRAAMDVMVPAGGGSIVATSSIWGERGFQAPVLPYATSKGAVSNLVRQLAVELAPSNVRVNAILPAGIRTSIADGFYDDEAAVAALAARIPMGRIVGPEAAVGPALFLASEASSWVTGHLLAVDGGYLAL